MIQRHTALRPTLDDLRPLIGPVVTRADDGAPQDPALDSLSPREAEVLGLVAEGLTNAEIASTLFLAVSTVKVHVRSVLRKLGLRTRTEAAIYAVTKRPPEALEPREQAEPHAEPGTQE